MMKGITPTCNYIVTNLINRQTKIRDGKLKLGLNPIIGVNL